METKVISLPAAANKDQHGEGSLLTISNQTQHDKRDSLLAVLKGLSSPTSAAVVVGLEASLMFNGGEMEGRRGVVVVM